ncbi:MAG: hypothetical protein K2K21_02680 [Lachnospiraceae bacterium]|nr:hypothetical protein [Lachnospiraceae bacterium]
MVAFVIFWSSFFALVFFVLGVIFKALASALNALLSSIKVLSLAALAAMIVIALFLLYAIVEGIVQGALLSVIGTIVMFVVVLGIFGAILGGLGAALLEFIVTVSLLILDIVSGVLEWLANGCESGYIKFLRIIINRLNKC